MTPFLSSTELGNLWMAYRNRSMLTYMTTYFKENIKDPEAKKILDTLNKQNQKIITSIEKVLKKEHAIIPAAFNENDIHLDVGSLFDDIFPLMFTRMMMKIALGYDALYLGMSYREDISSLFQDALTDCQETYIKSTNYLLKKGVLAKPPDVSMPKEVEYIEDKNYIKGYNIFSDKRSLNTIEVAYIYQGLESNIFGMQLMTGFAQVAREEEVREYFIRGKELAKKFITEFTETLLQSDVQPPSTFVGKATDSTIQPFSDRIMMYLTSLLATNALGGNALGTGFSLRSDLPTKFAFIIKDTFFFARDGTEIMIKHKWMEEPPQMEDRNQLTKSKQKK